MKMADLFGAGVPVCALDYGACLAERVRHGDNGLLFSTGAAARRRAVRSVRDVSGGPEGARPAARRRAQVGAADVGRGLDARGEAGAARAGDGMSRRAEGSGLVRLHIMSRFPKRSSSCRASPNAPDVQTLDNFIGGRWVKSRTDRFLRRAQPRGRRRHRTDAALDRAPMSTPPCRRRRSAFPAWRDTPVERARAGPLQVQGAARSSISRSWRARHDRARQDARRVARQRAPRHRVRRSRVRRAVADAGLRPRGHLARHRLPRRAPAARRRARRSRRSIFRRWCRCGSCRSRSSPATRSC